jgi:hypothetical protein
MSILTEDGIYNDTYIDCTIVKDNIISLLIHDKKNSVTRSYKFESIEKAEELANKLLQVIFEATEVKENTQDKHQKMWKLILNELLNGEPYMSEFHRFVDRLVFNRFDKNKCALIFTSNAMNIINSGVVSNVVERILDIAESYSNDLVMYIIIQDNIARGEHHYTLGGHKIFIKL